MKFEKTPERFEFAFKQRDAEIDQQIASLQAEKLLLQAERDSWSFEDIAKIAPKWDGKQQIKIRVRFTNRDDWWLLGESANGYVRVDAYYLREIGAHAALGVAEVFASGKYPRSGFTHGATTVYLNGSMQFDPHGIVEGLNREGLNR